MDTSALSSYDINIDVEKNILDAFNNLKSIYTVEFNTEFMFDINQYSTFYNKELNYFGPVIKNTTDDTPFYICFIELIIPYMSRSSIFELEYQSWGVFDLKRKYPRIEIRTETFLDKIHEFINPIELDFADDKEFSKKFFVITEDKQKAELYLDPFLRKAILEIEESEINIEIRDSQLIIGNKKILTTNFVLEASKFLSKLSKHY